MCAVIDCVRDMMVKKRYYKYKYGEYGLFKYLFFETITAISWCVCVCVCMHFVSDHVYYVEVI